jgi:hypothetical protein
LEQTRRVIDKFPDSSGVCIDRPDWLRFYNFRADDGISWRHDRACRSQYWSWRRTLEQMGPLFHAADKVIFLNALVNRIDLMRHVDGIYHEYAFQPWEINCVALQCVRRPGIAWTWDQRCLGGVGIPVGALPDIPWIRTQQTMGSAPDGYFQRHLYLGLFPTAPLPGNDHAINAAAYAAYFEPAWTEQWYLDYGPLFETLRWRKWVLLPHVVEAVGGVAKVNLFEVPGGYLIPVTLAGNVDKAQVLLRDCDRLWSGSAAPVCQALHPGSDSWVAVAAARQSKDLLLDVPLQRGCAMVKILTTPVGPQDRQRSAQSVVQ